MNNTKEVFGRERTEESIVDMDAQSGGSQPASSTGSPGSRFKVDTTTATGEPIDAGSPIISLHSTEKSASPALPPAYSPERPLSGTPTRGQIILKSPTPPPASTSPPSSSRPQHLPLTDDGHGNASERDALRGNHREDEEDDDFDEGPKVMCARPPIITGVPTIELPDGKITKGI